MTILKNPIYCDFSWCFRTFGWNWTRMHLVVVWRALIFWWRGKALIFYHQFNYVSSIPWIGSLAERVVSNLQFLISKKQSKTRAANFRLNLAFCVLVLVSCLCCLCCRSFSLQREVLWELAVTSIQGFKRCSETLERSSDNGYLRTQVWFPARHGSKLGLYETTVKISSALAFFFFFSKCRGTLISAKHIKINSL